MSPPPSGATTSLETAHSAHENKLCALSCCICRSPSSWLILSLPVSSVYTAKQKSDCPGTSTAVFMWGATPSHVPFAPPGVHSRMHLPWPLAFLKQLKPVGAQQPAARQSSLGWAQSSYAGFTASISLKPVTWCSMLRCGSIIRTVTVAVAAAVAKTANRADDNATTFPTRPNWPWRTIGSSARNVSESDVMLERGQSQCVVHSVWSQMP